MDARPLNVDQNRVLVMVLAGGEGKRLFPAHPRPREARRTVRRTLPHHRHRPLELRQLRAHSHQGAHAVQERVARGAHRARLATRAHPRPVHRGNSSAAAHREDLVPRLGRRRLAVPARHRRRAAGDRLHLRRRPRLQDGRASDARVPRGRPRRRDGRGDSRGTRSGERPRRHRGRRKTGGSWPSTRRSPIRRLCPATRRCASRRWATTSSGRTSCFASCVKTSTS